jgi:hypothetical protein
MICLGLVEVFGLAPALAVRMMLQVFAIVLVAAALGYAVLR